MSLLAAARLLILAFVLLTLVPLGLHAGFYRFSNPWPASWRSADWSSAGVLPAARREDPALVAVYAARAGRWRGIFAVHSWIVMKPAGSDRYTRYDVVGWGTPVRRNAYPADGRWYGNPPERVIAIEGAKAEVLIPRIEAVVADYPYASRGDYRIWPGPNSNSFVSHVLREVPEIGVQLPSVALGRDYPTDGAWLTRTPSGTGLRLTLGGYLGLTLGWVEGLEINVLGAVTGIDIRRPALMLPGFGRIGVAAS
ncbi:MAG: DUF3750 domain-containing protein [Pseudomonadota bacterium]